MSITVYTYNDKVLVNSANDKWLKKPDAPAGFVMNASNAAGISGIYVGWESPGYANNYYDGNGKTIQITISSDLTGVPVNYALYYAQTSASSGPAIIDNSEFPVTVGTYTFTMNANPIPESAGSNVGKYIVLDFKTEERRIADLSKITITILD